jgi:ribonuclease/clavin/mitogillin
MSEFALSAAVVILHPQPRLRVLLVRRAPDQRAFPNHWSFPGGKCDPEDGPVSELLTFERCARRECFEETGLHLHAPLTDLGMRFSPPFSPRRFAARYWLCELADPPAELTLNAELSAAHWWEPTEALARWQQGHLLMPPPVRQVLEVLTHAGPEITALRALANGPDQLYRDLQLHPGIEVIPLKTPTLPPATHTNCALFGHTRFVVVDPAAEDPDEQALLQARIEARMARGHRPEAIILTHHHRDHTGGAEALRATFKLPIYAHPETARLLSQRLSVDHLVSEGFCWDLGTDPWSGQPWQLQALHTPGHAPGHLCLHDLRHNVAHVGDMLAGVGTILVAPPEGCMADYLKALERLAQLDLRLAIPSHGPLLSHPTQTCQQYLKHRAGREARICEVLTEGAQEGEALLDAVYTGLPSETRPWARLSLQAHLLHLQAQGRIQAEGEYWQLTEATAQVNDAQTPGQDRLP